MQSSFQWGREKIVNKNRKFERKGDGEREGEKFDWNRLLFGNYRDFRCWLSTMRQLGSTKSNVDSAQLSLALLSSKSCKQKKYTPYFNFCPPHTLFTQPFPHAQWNKFSFLLSPINAQQRTTYHQPNIRPHFFVSVCVRTPFYEEEAKKIC